ncbi:MAG: class I SAM-dependent methyltransferase [Acidihalobacter sp.]|uniref:class I SAM-dependent methyltransferase n=1 Tax=Acidihalobacter sp. TaxID=1872108 RepID=UPI00307CCB4A
MTRIYSNPDDVEKPRIDREAVGSFFDERARKAAELGAIRAVIYQDKHPDLAERRNASEKASLMPLLDLDASQRVLDVGCGTGRWTGDILASGAYYHGTDSNEGLLSVARNHYRNSARCRFSVAPIEALTLQSIQENKPFDRILCAGVLIYLNDEEVLEGLRSMMEMLSSTGRLLLREPMGVDSRLTIKRHYSADLDQVYNAIYRTESELESMVISVFIDTRFSITGKGNVYEDPSLNNRTDTRQRWLLLERRA